MSSLPPPPPPLGMYLCLSSLPSAGEGDQFRRIVPKCQCWGGSGDAVLAAAAPGDCCSHGCGASDRGVRPREPGCTRRVKVAKRCLGCKPRLSCQPLLSAVDNGGHLKVDLRTGKPRRFLDVSWECIRELTCVFCSQCPCLLLVLGI